MSLYALIIVVSTFREPASVVIPGRYTWAECQRAGGIAMSSEHQVQPARSFLCVPLPKEQT